MIGQTILRSAAGNSVIVLSIDSPYTRFDIEILQRIIPSLASKIEAPY